MSRLTKAGLAAKMADGAFGLTPLGRLASAVLPSFSVLAARRDYFLSHDLSSLPPEFVRRIGELAEHRYLDHLDAVLGAIGQVTEGAKDYVRIMSDRAVRLEHHHPSPATVSVRGIFPRAYEREVRALAQQNWPGAHVEMAFLEPIPATLLLNERQAGVLFPGLDGQIDMNRGLAGDSPAFQGWCRDLFDTLWARARKPLM